jgi:hypothetical protein
MTTQTHKWLPSEPTPAMLEAEQFASSLVYESHEVQAIEVYKAMWQAATEREQEHVITKNDNGLTLSVDFDFLPVGTKFYTNPQLREPLSIDTVMSIVGSMPWEELYTEEDEWNCFARAIEKAHGIGVE